MAFADPLPYGAGTLPRVETDDLRAAYISNDENTRFDISHNDTKVRVRSLGKITIRKVAPDPVSAVNQSIEASLQFVIDRPKFGFSLADLEAERVRFIAWLTTANFAKLFGKES